MPCGNNREIYRVRSLALALATSIPGLGQASGFAVPEISITGLGSANALVANTADLGAVAYNPAVAAFHPGTTISGGLLVVAPNLEVTTATGSHESEGRDAIAIPMFQLTHQLTDKWTLGVGANAPFGLETEWDATAPVFPGFGDTAQQLLAAGVITPPQAAGIAGGHPTKSKIELVDLSPTVAYRLGPNTAVSAGVDYYRVMTVAFDALAVANEGDGDGWGWNAGLVHRFDRWSLGLSYRSHAEVDIEGDTVFANGASARARAELTVPWRVQAGVRYQASQEMAFEFDVTRTGWSSFDELRIDNRINAIVSTNGWEDANAYRFGMSYRYRPDLQFRLGYSFDQTPQDKSSFSARVPDSDRHLFSVGLEYDLGEGLSLEAGYMYVMFEDRTITGASYLERVAGGNLEPNGSDAYAGDYTSHVHLFGLGLAKRFN